jgi:hypothetical protein
LEYLGIILDTDLFEARLPKEKIERIVTFIQSSIERKSVRKRELLQLLEHFNFAERNPIPTAQESRPHTQIFSTFFR